MDDTQKPPLRLLTKKEVVSRVKRSYPSIWHDMRAGRFPRSREQGGMVFWLEHEIDEHIAGLPIRRLKGEDAA